MRMVPLVATAVLALSVSALSAQETKPPENVKPPEEMSQPQNQLQNQLQNQPQSQPQSQPESQPQEMGESEGVSPAVLEEVTQMALKAQMAAATGESEKTPEQIAADKKAIASHCEAVFARAHERDPDLPAGCE